MPARLEGRVAIVTGGARGIGQAYCLGLARAGAKERTMKFGILSLLDHCMRSLFEEGTR